MKQLSIMLLLAIGVSTTSTGCIIHSRSRQRTVVVKDKRSCPPAHHWEGGYCVHNGKAKGHHK
jgi:hypothetical protein